MSSSKTLLSMMQKVIKNFVAMEGQSTIRVLANAQAKEFGISSTEVQITKYNNEHDAAVFTVDVADNVREKHYIVKKSALLEYIIVTTNPKNAQESATLRTIHTFNKP